MTPRPGHTLAELMVALPLGALLLALLLATVVAQARLARSLTGRLGRAETERLAHAVLRHELRWAAAGDVAAAPDSISLRLLRGVAITCGEPGAAALVEYYGLREPNSAKDSVLIVDGAGERATALLGSDAAAAPCSAVPARSLRLGAPPTRGIVLVYERGAYFLSARALRFRSGAEGRQPLTEEWLDDAGTRLLLEPSASLPGGVALTLRDASAQEWRWALPNRGSQ